MHKDKLGGRGASNVKSLMVVSTGVLKKDGVTNGKEVKGVSDASSNG